MYAILKSKITGKELVFSLATLTTGEFANLLNDYELVEYTNHLVVR